MFPKGMLDKLSKRYKGWSESKKRWVVGGSVVSTVFVFLFIICVYPPAFALFVVALLLLTFAAFSYMIGDILTTEIKALR